RHSALHSAGLNCRPASPSGLSSIPSTLEPSPRLKAASGFFQSRCSLFLQNWCHDCLDLFKRLFQRCFPFLFPNSPEVVSHEGQISASVLEQRVTKAINYLGQQLRPRIERQPSNPDTEWQPLGIENELIQNSKIVVFLEYNGMKDYCYLQMNG